MLRAHQNGKMKKDGCGGGGCELMHDDARAKEKWKGNSILPAAAALSLRVASQLSYTRPSSPSLR